MLSPIDIMFWQAALSSICILTVPIAIVSGAPVWRSFLTATVVYELTKITKPLVNKAACRVSCDVITKQRHYTETYIICEYI